MGKLYGLSEKDRRKLSQGLARLGGMHGSRRPTPTRRRVVDTGAGGTNEPPRFTARIDTDLAADDTTASLGGSPEDYAYFDESDRPVPASLPAVASNIFKLSASASDMVLCVENWIAAWSASAQYSEGDAVYATDPVESPAEVHWYTRNADGQSGASFDATEEGSWTDHGLYSHSDWVVALTGKTGDGGGDTFVAWLRDDIPAAAEVDYSSASQESVDAVPANIQVLYTTNGGTLLEPGTGVGEIVARVTADPGIDEYPVYHRTFEEDVTILNTVKNGVAGGQFVQVKNYIDDGVTKTAVLDVAQCSISPS